MAPEQVQVAGAEEDGVQGLGDERDACERVGQMGCLALQRVWDVRAPSALELEWMAQMRMHLDTVCETSARMRKTFSCTMMSRGSGDGYEWGGCLL